MVAHPAGRHSEAMTLLQWFARTPPAWLGLFVLTMVPAEAAIRRRRGQRASRVETLTSVKLGVAYFLVKVVLGKMAFLPIAQIAYEHRVITWPLGPLGWIGAYVLGDFAYYWVHRAEHRVRLLWASHQVHHSSVDFNFAAAVRMPWTEVWFTALAGLWAPLLGVPPMIAATLGIVGLMVGLLQHTSMIGSLGWVDSIFMTPRNHRVHHASNAEYLDSNFGGGLVLWDAMFGTYVTETVAPRYGLTVAQPDRSARAIGAGGFPELWSEIRTATGARRRLTVALSAP